MHLPGCHLDLPALSEKDEFDLREFAVKNGVDMVAISLVRSSENVETVRSLLNETTAGKKIQIFSKIENIEGLNNFDEILAYTDGVIIMRE